MVKGFYSLFEIHNVTFMKFQLYLGMFVYVCATVFSVTCSERKEWFDRGPFYPVNDNLHIEWCLLTTSLPLFQVLSVILFF